MDAAEATETERGTPQEPASDDPRVRQAKAVGRGDRGREILEHSALGAELDAAEERTALDWLLGTPQPSVHDVPVDFDTPAGPKRLTFTIRAMDGRKIDSIEQRNRSDVTGKIDAFTVDCEVVAEATTGITDESGRTIKLTSEEFLTVKQRMPGGEVEDIKLASPPMALERRFRTQLGLVQGVAREVRRVSGWDPERVGTAQRRLVEASLG